MAEDTPRQRSLGEKVLLVVLFMTVGMCCRMATLEQTKNLLKWLGIQW